VPQEDRKTALISTQRVPEVQLVYLNRKKAGKARVPNAFKAAGCTNIFFEFDQRCAHRIDND